MIALLFAALVITGHSKEYAQGYSDAYCQATKQVWANRNHYHELLGYAPEGQKMATDRIYKHHNSPLPVEKGQKYHSSLIGVTVGTVLDGVDLYVVLPKEMCK